MIRKPLRLFVLATAFSAAPVLSAQSAHWNPPGGSLPMGEVSPLQLTFDDCSPEDAPVAPKVDALRLEYEGQSSNMSLIDGTFTRNVVWSYAALLSSQAGAEIPEFTVKTNKGPIRVPAAHFNAAGATVGSTGISLGDAAKATLSPPSDGVWAGEVFDLRYKIEVAAEYYPTWGRGVFEWDPSPLIVEDWTQPEQFETHAGSARTGLAYHTRAVAPAAGKVRLNPTSQLVNLSVGVTGFGFFQQRQIQQFAVPDSPASLEVRPLPPGPAGFAGAVGDFRISSKVVPLEVKVGEPITWTIELSGAGNWPSIRGLPAREAPRDFQVVQPKPKRTQPPGKLFEGTLAEDVVLVPTAAGTYVLPALDFVYFDPRSGTYKTISAPGASVTADPEAPPASIGAQTAAAPGAPKITLASPTTEAKPPEPPPAGLGDPLPSSESAPEPLRKRTLAAALAIPFALLGLFWAELALGRARATDPLKRKRDARRRLQVTLERVGGAPLAAKAPLLLAWQRDSALLWDVGHAAPPAGSVGDSQWAALWGDVDRFLYSTDPSLPPDWVGRAQAALARTALRPFSPASLLLPRNLFPLLVLALAAAAPRLGAAEPASAYRGGDFASAERGWRAQVASDPLDWAARHNLSLSLAQQDRWGEAAAHAAAAFVQNPSDPAVNRQLVLACDRAGFVPEPLDSLIRQGPVESLARLESPGAWQRVGIGAGVLLAAASALFLAACYRLARRSWAAPVSAVLFLVALIAGAASFVGYRAYGIAADSRVVVVWSAGILRSIPTEADVSQKTTPLPAGSTAVADKSFLGWIRISFPGGQTGWILRKEAAYLWRSPSD